MQSDESNLFFVCLLLLFCYKINRRRRKDVVKTGDITVTNTAMTWTWWHNYDLFLFRSSSINRHGSTHNTWLHFCYTKWVIENIQKNSTKTHTHSKGSNKWQDESLHSKIFFFVCLVHRSPTKLSAMKIKMCNALIIQCKNSEQAFIFSSQQILLSARCSNESQSEQP